MLGKESKDKACPWVSCLKFDLIAQHFSNYILCSGLTLEAREVIFITTSTSNIACQCDNIIHWELWNYDFDVVAC